MTSIDDATALTGVSTNGEFRSFVRAVGRLAIARQVSGILLVGATLVVATTAPDRWVTQFVWVSFAMFTISSAAGLGFEKLAGTLVSERGDASTGAVLAPLLIMRVATFPLVAASLWALLAFVGVSLPVACWWATFVWTLAALLSPIAFGGLRSLGNSTIEPLTIVLVRSAQSVSLVCLAVAGISLSITVATLAALELAGALVSLRALGPFGARRGAFASVRHLPARRGMMLASIEGVGLAYLRADLLLVGRVLGGAAGATYGLLYRVVDALNAVAASVGLWLYAEGSNRRGGSTDPDGLRGRSLRMFPPAAIVLAAVLMPCAALAGAVVPRLASETLTLRLLVAAFPLLAVNAIELHLRSARGRNAEVLLAGLVALAVNVPACLVLLPDAGLRGGAIALLVSEFAQAAILVVRAPAEERPLVGPAIGLAAAGSLALVVTAVAIDRADVALAVLSLSSVLAVVVHRLRPRGRRIVTS